jgi:hypothetical protein
MRLTMGQAKKPRQVRSSREPRAGRSMSFLKILGTLANLAGHSCYFMCVFTLRLYAYAYISLAVMIADMTGKRYVS